MQILSLMQMIY